MLDKSLVLNEYTFKPQVVTKVSIHCFSLYPHIPDTKESLIPLLGHSNSFRVKGS